MTWICLWFGLGKLCFRWVCQCWWMCLDFWCLFWKNWLALLIVRMVYTECNPSACPCGDRCDNQRIQKHQWVSGLEKFLTKDRGYGVKTSKAIKNGKSYESWLKCKVISFVPVLWILIFKWWNIFLDAKFVIIMLPCFYSYSIKSIIGGIVCSENYSICPLCSLY